MTLSEFLTAILAGGAFAGVVAAALTGALFNGLTANGVALSENARRWISLALPVVLVFGAYGVGILLGQFPINADQLWAVLLTAVAAVTGKQLAYGGWQTITPSPPESPMPEGLLLPDALTGFAASDQGDHRPTDAIASGQERS